MENASAAFTDAVRKSMRLIRAAIGAATTINPELLTSAERLQYDGYVRREEMSTAILKLADEGIAIKQIVRLTGHSRKLVRQVIRGQPNEIFRSDTVRWNLGCPGWTSNGVQAAATVPNCGAS